MLRRILSIAGRPGLYKLVSQGRNMLIVESLANGKRTPAYARDKVISLGDIAMYTTEEDVPLPTVLQALKEKAAGEPVDVKGLEKEGKLRDFFGEVLPNFDRDRVYTADIKKLFSWYNMLLEAGITDFDVQENEAPAAEEAPTEA